MTNNSYLQVRKKYAQSPTFCFSNKTNSVLSYKCTFIAHLSPIMLNLHSKSSAQTEYVMCVRTTTAPNVTECTIYKNCWNMSNFSN